MTYTRILFLWETVINFNGSVSYIFMNFGWFLFLIFPICYGLRFLNVSIFYYISSSLSFFSKKSIFFFNKTMLMSDLNLVSLNHQSFGICFWKTQNILIKNAIDFLVVTRNRFLFWNIQWVVVSYDWKIWWVVSYNSVSYRKRMHVF